MSIHDLVRAIADAENRPPHEVASGLWTLLSESSSVPDWLYRDGNVTSRVSQKAQETGWFALRALREGRACAGDWDIKFGFSLPALRTLFEANGVNLPIIGAPTDAEVLQKKRELVSAGEKFFLARLASHYGIDKDRIRRALARAEKDERDHQPANSSWFPTNHE
ncbi:hypothetical protein QZM18_19195 [Burkholderia diffusa]|uniref:hypothetical protein n=1 Tax=Burkholderia diffusa TaxID=488732 RepID=UPI0026559F5E|nr:hypothetical protein [Burkholderia diffusa]MDN7906225.1 hypothetical protein [Burkholderia diffusa]